MDSTERLKRKLNRHYHLASLCQCLADHYSRLTKIDCSFYDSVITEGIVEEFSEELEEFEDGVDMGEDE